MWVLAAWYFVQDNSQFITLAVFGLLALILGYADPVVDEAVKMQSDRGTNEAQRLAREWTAAHPREP